MLDARSFMISTLRNAALSLVGFAAAVAHAHCARSQAAPFTGVLIRMLHCMSISVLSVYGREYPSVSRAPRRKGGQYDLT